MATKNCPKCSKQVPVACKKCLCGHIFFLTRRGATTSSTTPAAAGKSTASSSSAASEAVKNEEFGDGDQPRRSGRVQREKTKFYDALQYENQTRKKQMLRRQTKQGSKSEDSTTSAKGNPASDPETEDVLPVSKDVKAETGQEPVKRRRGRPPGINGKKSRIAINHKPSRSNALHKSRYQVPVNNGVNPDVNDEDDDIMADITPEKALQFNIILGEINRKLASCSWKASS